MNNTEQNIVEVVADALMSEFIKTKQPHFHNMARAVLSAIRDMPLEEVALEKAALAVYNNSVEFSSSVNKYRSKRYAQVAIRAYHNTLLGEVK